MKNVFGKIILVTLLACALAFRPGDVLTDLKLSSEQVGEQVFNQLTAERPVLGLPSESRKIARQLSASMRVASVRALYTVSRAYVQSDDFRTRYDRWMRSKYHVDAGNMPPVEVSSDELRVAQEAQLAQVLATFSTMTPQMLSLMLPQQMATIQQQMREADAPTKAALTRDILVLRDIQPLATANPSEFKTRYLAFMKRSLTQQMGQGREAEEERRVQVREKVEDYQHRLAMYRANADPNLAIKKRLSAFITLAESVDFNAETILQGHKTEFVRADYRLQSAEWKQLYRLGREPVLIARDLARGWLSELN
ncbi:hypothetical protein [Salmonirosea aquatica]|uniref:Uncharacterized protein n=1 Tax=Salmonirosea aquatica TaxID=2654236 RepID=A0A7C9BVI7_9BACT|nr:hypothetical protein [Cytophagaceae bacterium SJW1-29]